MEFPYKETLNQGRAAMLTIIRNNVMGIKNLLLHKRVFLSRIMPILHYRAEIWGYERAAHIESIQLGYFQRLFGLHRNNSFNKSFRYQVMTSVHLVCQINLMNRKQKGQRDLLPLSH